MSALILDIHAGLRVNPDAEARLKLLSELLRGERRPENGVVNPPHTKEAPSEPDVNTE
jgi:hypothetical protein